MLPVTEIVLPNFSSNVPAFLAKLWKMVDDPDTNNLISWSENGTSFLIHQQAEFSHCLLPYYYKHSNMASFVRQLNMYGFHKVVSVEAGGLKTEKDQEMEFAHTFFLRDQEHLLSNIKRKVATAKVSQGAPPGTGFTPSMKTEKVTEMLNEVNQLKDKQEDMDSKLETMRKENEALWKEVVNLRQKHLSQQKIVNKLIQFLVSLVQPRMHHTGQAVKRRQQQQLAIESATNQPKEAKLDMDASAAPLLDTTPVISDVTHDDALILLSEDVLANQTDTVPTIETPTSPLAMAMRAVDPALVNPSIQVVMPSSSDNPSAGQKANKLGKVASPAADPPLNQQQRPVLQREISKEDFDVETMMMQKEIDNLKDIMSGQITLDPNLITNLFSPSEPLVNAYLGEPTTNNKLSLQMQDPSSSRLQLNDEDNEQPTLFDLADIDDNAVIYNSLSLNSAAANDDYFSSIDTPIVTMDTTDTNPLLAQITKKGRKRKGKA